MGLDGGFAFYSFVNTLGISGEGVICVILFSLFVLLVGLGVVRLEGDHCLVAE